jgi:hypothetical protein
MEENDLRDLESLFAQVEDPRMERTKLHRLGDMDLTRNWGFLRTFRAQQFKRLAQNDDWKPMEKDILPTEPQSEKRSPNPLPGSSLTSSTYC